MVVSVSSDETPLIRVAGSPSATDLNIYSKILEEKARKQPPNLASVSR